jgi:5'(3')-deoxyribonucleotidase
MTVYLDMDGVLADFFKGLEQFYNVRHWKQIQDKEKSIQALAGTDFFNTLDVFETSQELVDFAKSTGDWGICSSPLRGDRDNSAYWKRVWLTEKQFLPEVSKLIFTGQKENFAVDKIDGTPNILVDDKPSNIKRWNEAGGIGIRYQANEDDLVEYLFEELKYALS